jgi:hypothetical protein
MEEKMSAKFDALFGEGTKHDSESVKIASSQGMSKVESHDESRLRNKL